MPGRPAHNKAKATMRKLPGMLLAAGCALAGSIPASAQDRTACVASRVVGEASVQRAANALPARPGIPIPFELCNELRILFQ